MNEITPFRYLRWEICHGEFSNYLIRFKGNGERFYNEDLAVLCAAGGMTNNGASVEQAKQALILFLDMPSNLEDLLNDVLLIYESGGMKHERKKHGGIQKPAGNHARER